MSKTLRTTADPASPDAMPPTRRGALLLSGLMLAAGVATEAAAKPASSVIAMDGHVVLRAYQALVEEYLDGFLRALKVLALTSDAQTASWPALRSALHQLGQLSNTYPNVWLAQPDGGYASTDDDGPAQGDLRGHDYFTELMAGFDIEGGLVIDKATARHTIVVATPIVRQGQPIAALGVSVQARMIAEFVARNTNLPANYIFYALDEHGRAAIHTDPALMFTLPSDFGEPSLTAAVQQILSKPKGTVTYRFRGDRRTALFSRSNATRWRFVLVKLHT